MVFWASLVLVSGGSSPWVRALDQARRQPAFASIGEQSAHHSGSRPPSESPENLPPGRSDRKQDPFPSHRHCSSVCAGLHRQYIVLLLLRVAVLCPTTPLSLGGISSRGPRDLRGNSADRRTELRAQLSDTPPELLAVNVAAPFWWRELRGGSRQRSFALLPPRTTERTCRPLDEPKRGLVSVIVDIDPRFGRALDHALFRLEIAGGSLPPAREQTNGRAPSELTRPRGTSFRSASNFAGDATAPGRLFVVGLRPSWNEGKFWMGIEKPTHG